MRGSKRNLPPASGLIPLSSNRPKRPSEIQRAGPPIKKSRHESQEVSSSELVSRVETLLGSGNVAEAEALVVSVLSRIREKAILTSSITNMASCSLARPGGISTPRLPPAYAIGLLVIAKHPSGPSLLSRPAVLEQFFSLLSLSLGKSRLNTSSMATLVSKSRSINAFAANLLWIALKNQPKWPTKLIKIYLEDSLSDRTWVDMDECKALVLNIESALPPVLGDPRGLFNVLCTGEKIPAPVLSALGIPSSASIGPSTSQQSTPSSFPVASFDIAETVAAVSNAGRSPQTAKIIYGEDPAQLVSPRFESSRTAIENVIVTTLREALTRRSTTVAGGLSHGGDAPVGGSSSVAPGEILQTRSLLRTLALTAGMPEIRSLAAQRLELWFANPKLHTLAAALFAILALNCTQGASSLFDIDFIVTVVFRVRQKLFKNAVQASYLESICRLAEANANNIDILIKLCMASELPTISSICESFDLLAKQASKQQQPHLPSSVVSTSANTANLPSTRCVAETVRKLILSSRDGELTSLPDSLAPSLLTVVQNAIESVGKGQGTVHAILPKLLQRYPDKWTSVIAEVLHDRIIEAVANPNSLSLQIAGPISQNPPEEELISHTVCLFGPTRRLLRDLAHWIRLTSAASHTSLGAASTSAAVAAGINTSAAVDFLPCSELGMGLLFADRELHPSMQESAGTVVHRMWELSGGQGFGPVTLLRYVYAVTHIICQLQMISITRTFPSDALVLKKKAHSLQVSIVKQSFVYLTDGNLDQLKAHQICVRQLRSYYLRWFRIFVPSLFSSLSTSAPLPDVMGLAFFYLNKCLFRASFLEVYSPFDASTNNTNRSTVFPPFYAAEELWPTEKNQSASVYHLTCLPLSEKHALNLLRHGADLQRVLLTPTDAISIVCELIWRATAFAIENNSESMNFVKLEELILLLYKCCLFRSDPDFPSELAELAHRSYYWRVTMALVALAIHSPKTCGAYFWINFPTVRKLMEMVITNDFSYPPLSVISDGTSVESEYLNIEMDNQLITKLEAYLRAKLGQESGSGEGGSSRAASTPSSYNLSGKLVRCNPRGACRRPPDEELTTLKQLSSRLRLRRRLCSCRQPDFLLELILFQSTDLPQQWVIQLVESMGQDYASLPLQCLTDYIIHVAVRRVRASDERAFTAGILLDDKFDVPSNLTEGTQRPVLDGLRQNASMSIFTRPFGDSHRRSRLDSTSGTQSSEEMDMRFLHILNHLQEQAQSPPPDIAAIAAQLGSEDASTQQLLLDNVAEAVLHSFTSRLRDPSSLIRRAARYCLTLLVSKDLSTACAAKSVPAILNQSTEEYLLVLQSLIGLPGLSVALSSSQQQQQEQQPIESLEASVSASATTSRGMHFLDLILSAILIEDEIVPLTAYILFLGQLTEIASFEAWHPAMSCLSQLILNRRTLIQHLIDSDEVLTILAPPPPVVEGFSQPPQPEVGEFRQTLGFIVLENICRIMALNVEYFCTSTKVIPVNEKNSVLVIWPQSNQLPMELETIESNLLLLSRIPRRFLTTNSGGFSWWGHLLNIWFSFDGSGAPNLPQIVRLTESSEIMRTKLEFVSLSPSNEFLISPKLRAAFLVSGLPQLSTAALTGITEEDFLQMIVGPSILLLETNEAACLVECAARLQVTPSTANQKFALEALQAKAKEKISSVDAHASPLLATSQVFVRSNLVAPTYISPKRFLASPKESRAQHPPLILPTRHPVSPESPVASKNLWRGFFTKLIEAQADFLSQSEAFCSTLSRINSSATVRNRWMQDLVYELQNVQTPSKRGRAASSAVVSTLPMGDMLKSLPNRIAVTFTYSLIRSCLLTGLTSSDNKTASRYQKAIELSLTEFVKIAIHSALLERILLNPLRSALKKRVDNQRVTSIDSPSQFAIALPFALEQLESSTLDQQMEALTLYGVSAIRVGTEHSAWNVIRLLILQNQGNECMAGREKRSHLLDEVVHNTSPTILRECLRRVLQEGVSTLDSSLVLDLFLEVLNLPAFGSAVPFVEYHERPDPGNLYSHIHRLNDPSEGMHLIAHVCLEASKHPSSNRNKILSTRAPLLDLTLQSFPLPCLTYVEYLAGFRESPPATLPFDLTKDRLSTDLSDIARNLLLCLYSRRPGIIYALSTTEAQSFLRTPSCLAESMPECFEPREITRLGGAILICLSSNNDAVRLFAGPQSLALAVHHPRLSLRLLPLIAGLAQGRFDVSLTSSNNFSGGGGGGDGESGGNSDVFFNSSAVAGTISWKAFENRKHDNFYMNVLRFMEILAFPKDFEHADGVLFSPEAERYREHLHSVLESLIHVMASYYRKLRYHEQFEQRLATLLRTYRRGIGRESRWSAASVEELNWLAGRTNLFAGLTTDSPSALAAPTLPAVKNIPHLLASVQKIRNPVTFEEVENTLSDIEKVTENKPWFLESFLAEIEHRLLRSASLQSNGCISEDAKIQPLLFKLLFRFLRSVPQRALEVIERTYLPCLWGHMTQAAAIEYLLEASILAPPLVPRLLHAAASRLAVRSSSAPGGDIIVNAVKCVVYRLPLDGFFEACVEHITAGIYASISGPKSQKRSLNKG